MSFKDFYSKITESFLVKEIKNQFKDNIIPIFKDNEIIEKQEPMFIRLGKLRF